MLNIAIVKDFREMIKAIKEYKEIYIRVKEIKKKIETRDRKLIGLGEL